MERLGPIEQEISSLFKVYATSPIFGVEFAFEDDPPDMSHTMVARIDEDVEIVEDVEDHHAVAAYYAEEEDEDGEDGRGSGDEEDEDKKMERRKEKERNNVPVLDARLGLAVEQPPGNADTESLWRIL